MCSLIYWENLLNSNRELLKHKEPLLNGHFFYTSTSFQRTLFQSRSTRTYSFLLLSSLDKRIFWWVCLCPLRRSSTVYVPLVRYVFNNPGFISTNTSIGITNIVPSIVSGHERFLCKWYLNLLCNQLALFSLNEYSLRGRKTAPSIVECPLKRAFSVNYI